MFCPNCGTKAADNAAFCPECGAPLSAPKSAPAGNIPAPGYSRRLNDPKIIAAMKKNGRAAAVFGLILIPLPLIGFIIYSMVSGEMEMNQALVYGGIVSGIFLLFSVISAVARRAKKPYDATVIDKKERQVTDRRNSGDGRTYTVTEYITVARTTDGKTKKIVEREGSQIWAYDYLQVGDRFRYLPQFNFPYEHYDKSRAPYIACVNCAAKNPVGADTCKKCGIPLLK